jgi:F-type H+-transporting ATPase subunit b
MKLLKTFSSWCVYLIAIAASLHLTGINALASEGGGSWRSTYDVVMIWVNFAIFAFLLVKFLKAPLLNFLRGRKTELTQEITQLEDKREQISLKIKETEQLFEKSEAHFEDIKAKIIAEGEEKKNQLIESARQESRIMIEQAKIRVENQILQARNKFKSEMIDLAISLAMQRLPAEVTEADHQRLLDRYLEHTSMK